MNPPSWKPRKNMFSSSLAIENQGLLGWQLGGFRFYEAPVENLRQVLKTCPGPVEIQKNMFSVVINY